MLLTHTGLTGNQYTQIGTSYLHRNLYSPVQQRTLSDNAESLFYRQ
jgi:hypothetical protein